MKENRKREGKDEEKSRESCGKVGIDEDKFKER